ncbi:MAG: hypothetical protein NTX93_01720 [Bacteroidia bacterium]|nr:hypothetical protein [Bacteroidia bacterium]
MTGIFISKGITPGFQPGDFEISFDEKGKVAFNVKLSVHYDVCPIWLALSINHLEQAKIWNLKRVHVWNNSIEKLKADTLEKEFEYSMQAIIAIAISYEAFYANIKPMINIPPEEI